MSLDSFQLRVLEEFFERQSRFFLTVGGALAGFHLKHRRTKDLDLFTIEDVLDQGVAGRVAPRPNPAPDAPLQTPAQS